MNKVVYQLTTEDVSQFLTDFLDTYTYDDTEEIQNELDRKRMPYQRFERKKGK
ncbi:TPA: hypothetical protein LQA79_002791 [Enterococcus faecium]|uniref:hypothetical protein n=1 Tax=Enterococcus faecium TaxID=1352 RepID=UPI0015C654FE|nr:hypothetical protein [Enterococcus faecium]MBG0375745.1 hypothetical protein [Enterococcus faecium]MBH1041557.1 hypothetical protein [Enterococcus faecium]HAP8909799.1 hypothetical protein [Enterococcus faecium]HBK5172669.1 hypothetical protein [Enterococcus faecium]HBK5341399.1 hypothetical protein [Enterococcus faecium]